MGIIIAILFILVMLSFYLIVLLNMKVNRFKQAEQKQERMIEEMEASITAFLTDIEDENSRLIETLEKASVSKQQKSTSEYLPQQENTEGTSHVERVPTSVGVSQKSVEKVNTTQSYNAPRAYVQNAYVAHKKELPQSQSDIALKPVVNNPEPLVQTFEERVHDMYVRGMAIDEIAKHLSRGKTEIELLIKFQNKSK